MFGACLETVEPTPENAAALYNDTFLKIRFAERIFDIANYTRLQTWPDCIGRNTMGKFVLKRILMLIPVIIGVSFIVFAILSLTPGDPAQLILGADADPALLEQKRIELGLNEPFLVRYAEYLVGLFTGNLGVSYRTGLPVADEILLRLPRTLVIAVGGIALSVIVGIPLGMASAIKQYSITDYFARTLALLLTAIPTFWLGLMLLLKFVLEWGLLPATGADSWENYILPIVTLGASATATLTRTTRSSMLEVIRQDYIMMAKAKGVPQKRIITKHMIRNGILPVVTIVGMNIGTQIGGTVVIENIFAIPGMGSLIISSVRVKDIPTTVSAIVLVASFIGIMNLVVDILYSFIDPRIMTQNFGQRAKTKSGFFHGKSKGVK